MSWQLPSSLTCSLIRALSLFVDPGRSERPFEQWTGVGQLEVTLAVLDGARVRQGEHGFTAVALAAGHGADGAGGCNGGLRRVADAVLFDPGNDLRPNPAPGAPSRGDRRPEAVEAASADSRDRRCCPSIARNGPRSCASSMLVSMQW